MGACLDEVSRYSPHPGKAVRTPTILPGDSQLFLGRELARFLRGISFSLLQHATTHSYHRQHSNLFLCTGKFELWSRSNKLDLKLVP